MSLSVYNEKRNFKNTPEPKGKVEKAGRLRFVIQRHEASRLHYDIRLELGGVLKSWAVPKGPSLHPSTKRFAVMTEDHPVEYLKFAGDIPEGNYGAGHMDIWDQGVFKPVDEKSKTITEKQALVNLKKGELKFFVKGKKISGEFVLIRLKNDEKNWLLIKHRDEFSQEEEYDAEDHIQFQQTSMPSIRSGKAKKLTTFIQPMLATAVKSGFDDPDWIYEIKWDGYRAIAELTDGKVKLYSRNGLDFSERFKGVTDALKKLKKNLVLDGEIVLLNEKNLPDFQKLQHYENHLNYPVVFYVFDILYKEGKKMESMPLEKRKEILKKLLPKNPVIRYCDHIEGRGLAFLDKAKEQGLEGIMAKKKDSVYTEGLRSKEWLKIKNIQSSEAIIVGYTEPKGGRSHFGSLVLAGRKGKSLVYRGHVGTGFNHKQLGELKKLMSPLESSASPFKEKVPVNGKVTWLKPSLIADIAYTEMTRDGIFRHPAFLRLRNEKPVSALNEEIVEDMKATKNSESIKIGKDEVTVTNRSKLYWPEDGYTKGDMIAYYEKMAPFILPYLKNRPLSLKRNPNGIADKGFYHKDAGENAPSFVDVFPVESGSSVKTIDYIVCNNKATLIYVANLGCIEMNPWNSTTKAPDKPTWMVIDIDPADKNTFLQVIEVAQVTQDVLGKAGIKSYCKTSGASGLHVYVPMKNKYDYETVKNFAHVIAAEVNAQLPAFTSLERSLSKRGQKIYVDFLQNRVSQTLASAYSIRPVKGAQVSTPLDWKEVNNKLKPSDFTIRNIFKRLEKKGDLFKPVLTDATDIRKALKIYGG